MSAGHSRGARCSGCSRHLLATMHRSTADSSEHLHTQVWRELNRTDQPCVNWRRDLGDEPFSPALVAARNCSVPGTEGVPLGVAPGMAGGNFAGCIECAARVARALAGNTDRWGVFLVTGADHSNAHCPVRSCSADGLRHLRFPRLRDCTLAASLRARAGPSGSICRLVTVLELSVGMPTRWQAKYRVPPRCIEHLGCRIHHCKLAESPPLPLTRRACAEVRRGGQ